MGLFGWAWLADWQTAARWSIACVTVAYVLHWLFMLLLVTRSFRGRYEVVVSQDECCAVEDHTLPVYTILCPLYHEWRVLPQFTRAIESLDWPKEKLDVLLLLEADDRETIEAVEALALPAHFRTLIVPVGEPKTKPKACNYGLLHAQGEFVVIYDAEDIPERDQLKKAALLLRQLAGTRVICAQARLDFYNVRQNVLTRLFASEYALWFDLILPGLQSLRSPIPLGGTSNHFRTQDLRSLHGWDSYNVAEDCDLGMRIAASGHETVVFNSTTFEEANSHWGNWLRQRSRWIKGYLQTYAVHMRAPRPFIAQAGVGGFFAFQLIVGGKIFSLFVNPFFWIMTLLYIGLRPIVGPTIEALYPLPILYLGVVGLVFGNFFFLYAYVLGCLKRNEFDLIKYAVLVPWYWLCMSAAAWRALYQLVFKPYYWEKTMHGLHLPLSVSEPVRASVSEPIPN